MVVQLVGISVRRSSAIAVIRARPDEPSLAGSHEPSKEKGCRVARPIVSRGTRADRQISRPGWVFVVPNLSASVILSTCLGCGLQRAFAPRKKELRMRINQDENHVERGESGDCGPKLPPHTWQL